MLLSLTLASCSQPQPKTEYLDRVIEKPIPVRCQVPEVDCNFKAEHKTEIVQNMLGCIVKLKRSNEVCR
jgi:hypothetical protein